MKHVIIDSNVILRLLVRNVPEQTQIAHKFFKEIEEKKKIGEISLLVVNEVVWILLTYYKMDRSVVLNDLMELLAFQNIKIIEMKKEKLMKVLEHMQRVKFDFTDVYLYSIAGSKQILTFDKDFKKMASV